VEGAGVSFQVERFESAGNDRLELTGRWSGVRGLRFVRPSLTVQTEDGERRLLALLDHKPWAPVEGGSWIAAFPWDGGPVDPSQAELAVAPHVVVPLARVQKKGKKERPPALGAQVKRLEREVAFLREEREALIAERDQARGELDGLAEQRDIAQAERQRLTEERDSAVAERDRAKAERDAAVEQRDRIAQARDQALRERDAIAAEQRGGQPERDELARDRAEALRERDRALAARDETMKERDEAFAARNAALAERDAALGRGTGIPAVPAAELPSRRRILRARLAGAGQQPAWVARVLALGGLLTVLLVLLSVFKLI
jgi:hypothetical protein